MTIKIQTERTDIPVEIGDLKFSFDTSDESILEFRKRGEEVAEELKNIEINEDDEEDEIIKRAKEILQTGFEIMLGKGAFEKIYYIYTESMIPKNQVTDGEVLTGRYNSAS